MAVKAYMASELKLILSNFSIPEGQYDFQPMTSGLINDTFLVSKEDQSLYVLQRINHTVFENVVGLMANMKLALSYLHSDTYTAPQLLRTKEKGSYFQTSEEDQSYWRLMTFLKDSKTFDTAPNETIAFEAGRVLSEFHSLLEQAKPVEFADIIPRFHDLSLRKEQFEQALPKANSKKLGLANKAIAFAKETIVKLNAIEIDDLPIRVCHNDTKLNNILFSSSSQKALCLIDLDTLMAGHFMYDFGDAVRTIANPAAEDEQNHSKISFNLFLFKAFLKGMASNKPFLSKKEIASLSTGIVLMPFLHGLRALTDYLENNRYYKVDYENQNLDRALSLFDFTKKGLLSLHEINAIIKEEFKI